MDPGTASGSAINKQHQTHDDSLLKWRSRLCGHCQQRTGKSICYVRSSAPKPDSNVHQAVICTRGRNCIENRACSILHGGAILQLSPTHSHVSSRGKAKPQQGKRGDQEGRSACLALLRVAFFGLFRFSVTLLASMLCCGLFLTLAHPGAVATRLSAILPLYPLFENAVDRTGLCLALLLLLRAP